MITIIIKSNKSQDSSKFKVQSLKEKTHFPEGGGVEEGKDKGMTEKDDLMREKMLGLKPACRIKVGDRCK